MHVETGQGIDAANRAAEIRRATAVRLASPMPTKYLKPDELSEEATYFFVMYNNSAIGTARIVTNDPLADLSASVLDETYLDTLLDLDSEGRLGSVGRLWSAESGDVGAAAGWMLYREFLLMGLERTPYYVSEIRTVLRRRLLGIGLDCEVVGISSIPGLRVETVMFDVVKIVTDVLASGSPFGELLRDRVAIDLDRDTLEPIRS